MNDIVNTDQRANLPTTPEEMMAYMKAQAEAMAGDERRAGSSISAKNGILSVGDQPIPGNQFAAIILDAARLNTYYRDAYNPNNVAPPNCYAIGRNDAELAPHPDMQKDLNFFQPQAASCNGCPMNEYGSARAGTQGKACSNRRRLMLLVAGHYEQGPQGWLLKPNTDPEYYKTAAMLNLTLAPTSLAGWGDFVRKSAADYQMPSFGVIARVWCYMHPKHGKEAIGFEALAPTPPEWNPIIIERHFEAQREILQGYEPPMQNANNAPQRGGGFHAAQQSIQGQVV